MTESLRQNYLDPAVLQELGTLKLAARQLAEGLIAGLHRSPHRGGSVEFSEYIEYSPGHELRHVDWRVYGKSDRYYVKQFEDETNLQSYLVMDGSGSMSFRGEDAPFDKLSFARYLAATLAYLFIRQGDAVGALGFASTTGAFLPAAARNRHLDDIFYLLDQLDGEGETALDHTLQVIAERAGRRSLVMIFSDFLDATDKTYDLLRVMRSRRLDVVCFHIIDQAELELPFEGLTLFEGMEGDGELLVDPDDIRQRYKEAMAAHQAALQEHCERSDITYLRCQTSTPIEEVGREFFRRRR